MKKLCARSSNLLIFLSLITVSLHANSEKRTESGVWNSVKEAAVCFAKTYGANLTFSALHELGHALTAQLALKAHCQTLSSNTTSLNFWYLGLTAQYPEFKDPMVDSAVSAAGPLLGILGIYCVLKGITIYNESKKSTHWQQAVKNGMKKSMFNKEQPLEVRALALAHLMANVGYLIPYKSGTFKTDGAKILEKLSGQEK